MKRQSTTAQVGFAVLLTLATGTAVAGFAGTDLFLPMAGRQAGVHPSNWYTTVWVHNPGMEAATARIYFLERGTANPSPPSVDVLVAPGDTEKLDNIVETLFHVEDFGALRVTCATEKLIVTSRVYSKELGAGEADSVGQDFAGVPAFFAIGLGERSQILGAYQTDPAADSEYRFNFGVVETTGHSAMVRFRALDDNGDELGRTEFQVREYSQRQVAFKDHFSSVSTENARMEVEVISGEGKVIAYGSQIANGSQDPTTFEMAYAAEAAATISGLVPGGITFGSATGELAQDAGALFWDDANNRLGLGTATPTQQLSLTGNLALPETTAAVGQITLGGERFLHAAGANDCTFVGRGAGVLTGTGSDNTGVGRSALGSVGASSRNTAAGAYALSSLAAGSNNTAAGFEALTILSGGGNNTAFGAYALRSTPDTSNNSAFGFEALRNNTAHGNSAFGSGALRSNTSGAGNSAFGTNALGNGLTGQFNTGVGNSALLWNTTGNHNTAVGYLAMMASISAPITGQYNTAVGGYTLLKNSSGEANTAGGYEVLDHNTTGSYNTASGASALSRNTEGERNTAIGVGALYRNTVGDWNTALGIYALDDVTTGGHNVGVGQYAGKGLQTGNQNVYVAAEAGGSAESGTMRIGTSGDQTRTFLAGVRAVTTANGNAIPVMIDSAGQLGTVSSSLRFKQDIGEVSDVAVAALGLRPVRFRYRAQPDTVHFGLIAEEVADVLPELVVHGADGMPETVAYHELPALLLALLQRQQATIATLEARLAAFEARLPGAAVAR
jgi:hypothetical protein